MSVTTPETRSLYIVLSRSKTALSHLIHWVTGDEYTHAALSLDSNLEYMFSFGRRRVHNPFFGCFRRERLDEGLYARHTNLPGVVMELEVTLEEYDRVREMLEQFLLDSHRYGYHYTGLFQSLLRVPSDNDDQRFVCSEFVYHLLKQCGISDLGIPESWVTPQDLLKLDGTVIYEGDLKQYGVTPRPAAAALSVLSRAG